MVQCAFLLAFSVFGFTLTVPCVCNSLKNLDENAFVDGLWDGAENSTKSNVEKSQLESVENVDDEHTMVQYLQNINNYDILKDKIANGEISLTINSEMQNRHVLGTKEYIKGRSYITISIEELQNIINSKHATGRVTISKSGQIKETIFIDKIIGVDKDLDGREFKTNGFKIHYSKSRTHIVPYRKKDLE